MASPAASDREPLKAEVPTNFWDGDDPNLSNLVTHPFANKAYVQRQTRPIRDRLNELDELTSENSRKISAADTRAQRGIQMASEKASLADQHATDAMTRAQLAKAAAIDASMRVAAAESMVGNLEQYNGREQTEIRFRPGQNVLSRNAKNALDTMAGPLKSQNGYLIEVHGIAPGRGHAANANAKKMSDSVVRYLVSTHKIPMYRISVLNMSTGKRTRSRRARGRVEISLLKNGTVDTARR
ncbi:MAG TPA: OmpA family protein [Candidatus Sulfotelmatobacter sp.]|jgi:outer membrane protein OmpA-like peptidoglycan-associated protein